MSIAAAAATGAYAMTHFILAAVVVFLPLPAGASAGAALSPAPAGHDHLPSTRPGEPPLQSAARPPVTIAFVRGGDVYVSDGESGEEHRLTHDGVNTALWWTADGQSFFFTKHPIGKPAEVWRRRPEAGPELVRAGPWSPDGRTVAFAEMLPGALDGGERPDPGRTVWIERDQQQAQITPAEPGIRWQPLAWLPDGRRLALARYELPVNQPEPAEQPDVFNFSGATLWVTDGPDPLAGRLRLLSLPQDSTGQSGVPDVVRWSPDGKWVLVGVGPAMPCVSCRVDGLPFYAIPVAGGPAVPLDSALADVTLTGLTSGVRGDSLAWSPDGAWLVLSAGAGRETYVRKQLVRFDPATGAPTDLSGDPARADI
ncbi:MAG: hypothetical protein HY332_24995 [Chloroflexi bacterium]|nr:hypothetical protein [Chloroflexota bacterium]